MSYLKAFNWNDHILLSIQKARYPHSRLSGFDPSLYTVAHSLQLLAVKHQSSMTQVLEIHLYKYKTKHLYKPHFFGAGMLSINC